MYQVEYKVNNITAVRQLLYELQYHGILSSPTSLYGVNKQANKLVEEDLVSYCNVMAYTSIKLCKSTTQYNIIINKRSSVSIVITSNINI